MKRVSDLSGRVSQHIGIKSTSYEHMKPHISILESNFINHNTPILKIKDPLLKDSGIKLFIKREDLNHPELSGNKWHKLKYNLIAAKEKGYETLLTFGGAY